MARFAVFSVITEEPIDTHSCFRPYSKKLITVLKINLIRYKDNSIS